MSQRRHGKRIAVIALATAAIAAPAAAQLLPKLPLPNIGGAGGVVGGIQHGLPIETPDLHEITDLTDLRRERLDQLVHDNPRELEFDDHDNAVVRGEVLAVSPDARSLAIARKAGFEVAGEERLEAVGLTLVTLRAPAGMSARRAVRRLRQTDPRGDYDYNHIYSDAGPVVAPAAVSGESAGGGPNARVGLVDTGVDAGHPALAGVRIEQHGFAPGGIRPAAHGTATASLIAGRAGRFHGAAPGASLVSADVYGTGPTGGSAAAVVKALAWMAREKTPVVNVSLVGPANASLEAVVKALNRQGTLIVAAVGNDGPAAPPLYPASYPGVIAVTGVDAKGRVLLEAGRARHLDFAAPGADMAAAEPGGYAAVRGTSYAAPIVAGELARLVEGRDPASAKAAVAALARQAKDLGPKGFDKTYGHGLVGEDVRVAPDALK